MESTPHHAPQFTYTHASGGWSLMMQTVTMTLSDGHCGDGPLQIKDTLYTQYDLSLFGFWRGGAGKSLSPPRPITEGVAFIEKKKSVL